MIISILFNKYLLNSNTNTNTNTNTTSKLLTATPDCQTANGYVAPIFVDTFLVFYILITLP